MENNALEKFNPAALAAIIGKEELATINDPFAGGIKSGDFLPQISIRGNRLRLKMDGVETVLKENFIEVFLVTSRSTLSKVFYRNGYDAGSEAKAPDCSSSDSMYPDPNIQSPESTTCQLCPNNAWGSKISAAGKQSKACSDYKLIVLALTMAPEKAFALRIPAASLKPFASYISKLNLAAVPANAAKTRISLGDTEYPTLEFEFVGAVDTKEAYEAVTALAESSDVLNAVKIAPRASTTHTAEQPVAIPTPEPTPEPTEPESPSLEQLLGGAPKTAAKKAPAKKKPAPAAEVVAETPVVEEEGGEQITSLDQLLGKLKK